MWHKSEAWGGGQRGCEFGVQDLGSLLGVVAPSFCVAPGSRMCFRRTARTKAAN